MFGGKPGAARYFASIQVIAVLVVAITTVSLSAQSLEGAHIIGGPTVEHISGSAVTVTWVTDKAKEGLVKWGARKGHYKSTLREALAVTRHSLALTGLTPDTTYHFKVKTGTAHSADETFTTANYSDAPFTFASMGDNRGPNDQADMVSVTPSFQNILDSAVAKRPAFTIHVGDFYFGYANLADTQQMYSVFKAAIQPLAAIGPVTITPGNHEMTPPCASPDPPGAEGCTPAYDPFALFNQEMPGQPQNGPPGYVGTCFSFNSGNSHVASIDTCRFDAQLSNPEADFYDLSDAEIAWLDEDLTRAQQAHFRHIFVFGHAEAWSADGVRWTSGSSGTQTDLYAETGKVAVGSSGTILTSQDGTTWTAQASGTTAALRDVVQGILLVAVGDSGTILTSPDGTAWTPRASTTSADLRGAANLLPYIVVVGSSGTILTSLDGIVWDAATSPTGQDLCGVTKGAVGSQPLFMAVGKAGTILTSSDGRAWTASASGTTADLYGVARGTASGDPVFAAVGSAGAILTSPDGISWTPRASGVTATLRAVANSGFIFIAVGDGGTVVTSQDGIGWTSQDSQTTSDLTGIDVSDVGEIGESEYFAVGKGGTIQSSPEWLGAADLGAFFSQRAKFWEVLKRHGVDAYICGHVHLFDDGFVQDGVIQWLNGNSGNTGTGNGQWTLWSINGDTATANLLDESGNVAYTRVVQSAQP
jgi:hypothetical protein